MNTNSNMVRIAEGVVTQATDTRLDTPGTWVGARSNGVRVRYDFINGLSVCIK